ncbi:MAG: cupin domain-containing protein [Candidatus Marinimicrobia bacterium]|nr:cupin domain-containing protein [Candidatus Neomarinimicrobiota bacterium]
MNTKNFDFEPEFKSIPTIEKAAELLKTDHTHAILMSLNPGDYIEKHTAGMEVSFFLSEGELDFEYGDEVKKITAGTMVQGDKTTLHGFRNNSDKKVKILVIKHLTTK